MIQWLTTLNLRALEDHARLQQAQEEDIRSKEDPRGGALSNHPSGSPRGSGSSI